MTGGELHDRLMQVGARLMVEALAQLEAGTLRWRRKPTEGVTYARKIDKAETRIDWQSRPARCTTTSARCRPSRAPGAKWRSPARPSG